VSFKVADAPRKTHKRMPTTGCLAVGQLLVGFGVPSTSAPTVETVTTMLHDHPFLGLARVRSISTAVRRLTPASRLWAHAQRS
jgi:hypothetical protein